MDAQDISHAHVVGNSMGGRIAIEMGLMEPERIRSLGLLCPAVAWVKRGFHPLVRLLRPEFGLLPHGFTRNTVASQFWSLFYDRDLIDPEVGELMVDEFRRIYHSPGARLAFLASARNIYLEAPYGRHGFYPRLAELRPPAMFVWGTHDGLVPAAFGRHVRKWLPGAEQVTIQDCGHVPQVERPEETNDLLLRFIARNEISVARPGTPQPAERRRQRRPPGRVRSRALMASTGVAGSADTNGHVDSGEARAPDGGRAPAPRCWAARCAGWRARCRAGSRARIWTSAIPTSSASGCRSCGWRRACGTAARCGGWATSPTRARC